MWLIIQPCTPNQTKVPDLHTNSTSTCSPVPAATRYQKYLATSFKPRRCTPVGSRHPGKVRAREKNLDGEQGTQRVASMKSPLSPQVGASPPSSHSAYHARCRDRTSSNVQSRHTKFSRYGRTGTVLVLVPWPY